MDMSAQEGDIPVPITSSYGLGHIIHEPPSHNHILPSSATAPPQLPSNGLVSSSMEEHLPYKKVIRYRECLKNHAASMGGNATDGCGEFMPSGEEGTLEALKCSACNCHRNFHRKEMEGETSCDCYHLKGRKVVGQKGVLIAGSEAFGYPTGSLIPRPHPQMIMSYNLGGLPSESDEQEGGGGTVSRPSPMKKRFRTKFTPEQKEKMLSFAEKVGWRIQKQEESVVQQFCQEIGVKRRVLKVWMHNNKLNLAKKTTSST
ncbi:zinc-finger homeodomain protein 4-like [Aristolochia californica]|uniref:zinc-finger homeodomain protein 4-like n=1 Tax=Aristolochia californica TaxID=171875 RepID=UPI0035D85B62